MSTQERSEATAKNLKGKAQEMMGEVTGDPKDKAQGRSQQADAEAQQAKEDVKEQAKKDIERS